MKYSFKGWGVDFPKGSKVRVVTSVMTADSTGFGGPTWDSPFETTLYASQSGSWSTPTTTKNAVKSDYEIQVTVDVYEGQKKVGTDHD
ncbi:hypothetical protein VR44_40495, partial [Streptomyces katrae]